MINYCHKMTQTIEHIFSLRFQKKKKKRYLSSTAFLPYQYTTAFITELEKGLWIT